MTHERAALGAVKIELGSRKIRHSERNKSFDDRTNMSVFRNAPGGGALAAIDSATFPFRYICPEGTRDHSERTNAAHITTTDAKRNSGRIADFTNSRQILQSKENRKEKKRI